MERFCLIEPTVISYFLYLEGLAWLWSSCVYFFRKMVEKDNYLGSLNF